MRTLTLWIDSFRIIKSFHQKIASVAITRVITYRVDVAQIKTRLVIYSKLDLTTHTQPIGPGFCQSNFTICETTLSLSILRRQTKAMGKSFNFHSGRCLLFDDAGVKLKGKMINARNEKAGK